MPTQAQLTQLRSLRDLAGTIHRFGWTAAKTKTGGVKAVGTGPDSGKKPLYGKRAEQALARAAKSGGGEAGPASPPFVPTAEASGPTTRPVPVRRSVFDPPPGVRNVGGGDLGPAPERPPGILPDDKPARPTRARRVMSADPRLPARPAAAPPPAAVPPAAVEKALDAAGADDESKYGKEQAGILKLAARAILRGMNVLGGGLLGAGVGFGMGTLIGGPVGGMAGLAAGGLAGVAAGARPGLENLPSVFQSPQRMRAGVRKVARAVVPRVAGAAAGLPAAAAGTAASVALPVAGASAGGVPGLIAGMTGGLVLQGRGYEAGARAAKKTAVKVRNAMVTSPVSVRKAKRANQGIFSELRNLRDACARFADAAADPVAILKERIKAVLAQLGVQAPEIPDHVVQKALEQAAARGAA